MTLSVLISVYKDEVPEFFDRAFQSIWDDQVRKPDEIILVKDGPLITDLDLIIDKWKQRLGGVLKTVNLPENVGLGAALNEGLKYCEYELVARMDTDDISMPQRFRQQIEFFKTNPDIDILSSWAVEIDKDQEVLRTRTVPETHDEIIDLLWAIPVIHPAAMFKKNAIIAAGSYEKQNRRRQDYDLWFRSAFYGLKFANIQEPLIYYRFTNEYFKKNNFQTAIKQTKIGIVGCWKTKAPLKAYIGVTIPLIRAVLPRILTNSFQRLINKYDPRNIRRT